MNLEEVLANARDAGLTDLDTLRTLVRSAVVLLPCKSDNIGHSRGSRLGGRPALPDSIPWPQWNGKSLSFVAQIDLGAQPKALLDEGFPEDGLLLFFYDAEQSTWGFDPKDAGSFVVLYVPVPVEATVAEDWPSDLPEHARFESCDLTAQEIISVPPSESVCVDDLELDQIQNNAYQKLEERILDREDRVPGATLGGYPVQVQGDMMLECAMVNAGLYCGGSFAYDDPRFPSIRESASEWRLLLQVDSVDEAGMMWGDVGSLYFWIRESDLKARRFDRSWMILQCF